MKTIVERALLSIAEAATGLSKNELIELVSDDCPPRGTSLDLEVATAWALLTAESRLVAIIHSASVDRYQKLDLN